MSDRTNPGYDVRVSAGPPLVFGFVLSDADAGTAQSTIVIRRESVWNSPAPEGSSVWEITR